jgi:IMP dehydrogenase/GMP reductase
MLGSLLAGTDEAPGEEIIFQEENSNLTKEWVLFLQ